MQAIVNTVNDQIGEFIKMIPDFEITPKNVIPRIWKNVTKFKISFIVIYYFTLLMTTIFFSDIYASLITTAFMMILGMVLMKHTIAIKFDDYEFSFGVELFMIALFGIPSFIALMTESFGHFLAAVIIALIPIIAYSVCFVEGEVKVEKKEKKEKKSESSSSSEDDDEKKKRD